MAWAGGADWFAQVEEQRLLGELFALVARCDMPRQEEIDMALDVDPDTSDNAP